MAQNNPVFPERRHYIRLDTVLPVLFRLISQESGGELSDWLQGFTSNLSKGGICLEVNNLCPEVLETVQSKKAKILLNLELPVTGKRVPARARIAWTTRAFPDSDKYLIGLAYEEIDAALNSRIIRFAWMRRLFVPLASGLVVFLGAGFILGSYLNYKLIKGNKALVQQLVGIVQDSSVAKQKVKEIAKQREDLQREIQTLQSRIQVVETEKEKSTKGMEELNVLMERMRLDKAALQERLITLQRKEGNITEELLHLDKKKANLEKANLDKMYQWLQVHQNPDTGLVISFEGDNNVGDWAFTYDQSLVLQAYANFADFERAKKLLDFYEEKAQRQNGLFLNAYYASDGSAAEYTIHCGPNIWLGIAILQYGQRSGDQQYLKLAEEIAAGVIELQDQEGGIRGGPQVSWYATEHNLDAYSFFNMLYEKTEKFKYREARDKVLEWLVKHTYADAEIPIKRGKGDATIATDTYAWSIAAIGPEKLEELGLNPDRIMEFAEEYCSAEVIFNRPEGFCVKIKGFDFAPERNLSRGGVVSSEWTAQMVISLKIMADYYYKKGMKAKAHAYEMKSDEYLSALGKMIISSPSPSGQGQSCLPYATQQFVDTGHGWMTPKGDSTGCVSGTAYALFAYYNYNPLAFKQ